MAIMHRDFANFRKHHETAPPMSVIERSDGSPRTCDDVGVIALYHELAVVGMVGVVIAGHDLTLITVA